MYSSTRLNSGRRGCRETDRHGETKQQISEFGRRPRWSPDGARLLFESEDAAPNGHQLFVTAFDARPPRRVLEGFLAEFVRARAEWHPDSQRLSVWGVHRRHGASFWTVPLDGGTPVRSHVEEQVASRIDDNALAFLDEDENPLRFRWSRTGDALFFEGLTRGVRNLWKIGVDPATLAWTGGPERLTTAPAFNTELALRNDGKALAFVARREHIRVWSFPLDPRNGALRADGEPLTSAALNALAPDLSPDGRRLVFKTEKGGAQEVWEKSLDTHEETLLVKGDAIARWLFRWANDNRRVSYTRRMPGSPHPDLASTEIISVVAGSGEQVSPLSGVIDLVFDWSSDGTWVVGSKRGDDSRYALHAVRLTGGDGAPTAVLLASEPRSDTWQARISPNQRWIVYSAARRESSRVYTISAEGGTPISLTDGEAYDDRPSWSADGRLVYFLSNRSGRFNVWARRVNPHTGRPDSDLFQVSHFDQPTRTIPRRLRELALAVRRDRLVVPLADVTSNVWILDGVGR